MARIALNSATNLLRFFLANFNNKGSIGLSMSVSLNMFPQRIWTIGCIVTLVATNLLVGKEKERVNRIEYVESWGPE